MGKAFSRVCVSVCLLVCLFVRALKGKRLELSAPNLVHIYSIAATRHTLTHGPKGQKSRSHGYENRHGRTVVSDMCCYGRVLLLPAWVCMSIRLPTFSSSVSFKLRIVSSLGDGSGLQRLQRHMVLDVCPVDHTRWTMTRLVRLNRLWQNADCGARRISADEDRHTSSCLEMTVVFPTSHVSTHCRLNLRRATSITSS